MNDSTQKTFWYASTASLVALIALCIGWEWLLAPLRPGGSWLVLKALPLLLPLRGVWRRDVYTLQWASMLILLYLAEGTVRVYGDRGTSALLAGGEVALSCIFFACVLAYLRPIKKSARELARKTIQKAAQ